MLDLEEWANSIKKMGFPAIIQIMVSILMNFFPYYDFCLVGYSKTKLW